MGKAWEEFKGKLKEDRKKNKELWNAEGGFLGSLKAQAKSDKKEVEERRLAKEESLQTLKEKDKVVCPKCLSEKITSNKRGFKIGRALLFLPLGFMGMNKIELNCLICGHKFKVKEESGNE